ncbi:MAG: pitrilysin family protein [Gemmatimonadetes bacterium]|nr:pitrilysin family protein [Gemmatimonadota bacterium]
MIRRWLSLAFVLAVSASPMRAQESGIDVPYTSFYLPNGLNVILHEDHTTPTVSVNMWYNVGSGREVPGRSGFAHLFEHIMFEGSGHVPEGMFDEWLEAAGGNNNGSTTSDRTNYWIDIPTNALDLALFLESDRMGYLLDVVTPESVDGQRDVVKNERRQSYENRPYGMAFIELYRNLFSADHPYSWPTIGSMEDLSAASFEDVVNFFRAYYGPNNASLSIAGDIDVEDVRQRVEHWFSDVESGPPVPPLDGPAAFLNEDRRITLEDRVQLPRLYMCWLSPAVFTPGDAELDVAASILATGKNSRLYRRLVYDLEIAQDVSAFQASRRLDSFFCVIATARSGHSLTEIETVLQEELNTLQSETPSDREVEGAVNRYESSFLNSLERIGGFGGKADRLNRYYTFTGNPDFFSEDLARYRSLSPNDISSVARRIFRGGRVILSVVPNERTDLAATGPTS